MRALILTLIMISSLWSNSFFSPKSLSQIEINNNAIIIIKDNGNQYILSKYNIVCLYYNNSHKDYILKFYGYYEESIHSERISKADYEKLKRILIRD